MHLCAVFGLNVVFYKLTDCVHMCMCAYVSLEMCLCTCIFIHLNSYARYCFDASRLVPVIQKHMCQEVSVCVPVRHGLQTKLTGRKLTRHKLTEQNVSHQTGKQKLTVHL